MPRYYIDTDDGDFEDIDGEGYELPNAEAARKAAIDALPDMARQKLPDGDRRVFAAQVRDESGAIVYVATLTLVGEWWIPPSS